ncbi:glucosaminidase domain-containing protein [Pelagibacterales bacterium SAG-MED20]|nr:glucosaminidase domain-containing protein [Pelagibacterales bacterium SAG-MED20]
MIKKELTLSKINKYLTDNKISISEIQKFLKKNKFNLIKQNRNKDEIKSFGIFFRTFISSLIIIFVFYISPSIHEFQKQRKLFSEDFENNSKNNLKKVLEKQEPKLDDKTNKQYLFDDILAFDDLPNDTVRLSAATIVELFKSTNYDLKDVRKNKLVKPVSLTLLPNEIKKIENVKIRKNLFIQIILPLIIKENQNIRLDRKKLFNILNKSKNSRAQKKWIESKFKQYGVVNKDLLTLKMRMDEIPVSLAIAQAAKETGWGTSRFALEGNALFGQWTWSGEGLKPIDAEDDTTHKVMKFKVLQASVKAYQRNLNTHSSYKSFRSARAELRDSGKELDSMLLTEHLDKYAETGKEYVKTLQKIIRQNNLTDFDDAKLLPASIDLKSLI